MVSKPRRRSVWRQRAAGPDPRRDLLAGLTVGAVVVPQALAYAELAGVDPVNGLYAAFAAMVVYALAGSSPVISLGPTATSAVLASTAAGAVDVADPAAAVTAAALLAGGLALAAGVARLGFLANLLSRPVLLGYTAGAAVIIALSQVEHLLGARIDGRRPADVVAELPGAAEDVSVATVMVAAVSLALLVLLSRPAVPVPPAFVVMVGGIVAGGLVELPAHGVATIGDLPRGLPRPGLPDVGVDALEGLLLPALAIALVGFVETVGQARALADPRSTVDANRELRAVGAANLAVGAVGGFAVSSSFSRNALNQRLGGRTRRTGLVAAGVVVVVTVLLPDLLGDLPLAVLGAVVLHSVSRLVPVRRFVRLAHLQRDELLLALAATAGVLVLGILPGLLVAVTLSIGTLLYRISSMDAVVLGYVASEGTWRRVDRYPEAETQSDALVVRFSGPLYFANAPRLRHEVTELVAELDEPPWRVVLEARGISHLDSTAMTMLSALHAALAREGIGLVLAGLRRPALDTLLRSDLAREVGEEHLVYPTVRAAVAHHGRGRAGGRIWDEEPGQPWVGW